MDPKGANLASTDLLEISELVSGSYVTKSITGQEIIDSIPIPSTGITIGTTAITSGTVGRVLFEGTGNVVQESANLFWDNTNGWLGIGTSSPIGTLNLVSDTNVLYQQASSANFTGKLFYAFKSGGALGAAMALYGEFSNGLVSRFGFSNNVGNTTFQIGNNGNVQIGTTTDAGFRLDVNGTTRFQGVSLINSGLGAISTNAFQVTGSSGSLLRVRGFGDVYLDGGSAGLYVGTGGTAIQSGAATFSSNQGAGNPFFSVIHNNGNVAMRALSNSNVLLNPTAGNVLIGTTTDAGFKLDVNGTARVKTLSITSNNTNTAFQVSGSSDGNIRVGVPFTVTNYYSSNNHVFNNVTDTVTFATIKSTGNLLINTTTDVASSKLTIESTTQGFLPPRMTTTQKNAIASPVAGLMVYDTTLNVISFYNGTMWV